MSGKQKDFTAGERCYCEGLYRIFIVYFYDVTPRGGFWNPSSLYKTSMWIHLVNCLISFMKCNFLSLSLSFSGWRELTRLLKRLNLAGCPEAVSCPSLLSPITGRKGSHVRPSVTCCPRVSTTSTLSMCSVSFLNMFKCDYFDLNDDLWPADCPVKTQCHNIVSKIVHE